MLKYQTIRKCVNNYFAEKQEIKHSMFFAFGNINSGMRICKFSVCHFCPVKGPFYLESNNSALADRAIPERWSCNGILFEPFAIRLPSGKKKWDISMSEVSPGTADLLGINFVEREREIISGERVFLWINFVRNEFTMIKEAEVLNGKSLLSNDIPNVNLPVK